MNHADPAADLARLLAIPEREPDTLFVARVDRLIDVEAVERAAARARREQLTVELAGAAALLLAARELLVVGDGAVELVVPALTQVGAAGLLAATLFLFLTLISMDRFGRTQAG
jgi:hypothetical protein